jgi:hypothetical protein
MMPLQLDGDYRPSNAPPDSLPWWIGNGRGPPLLKYIGSSSTKDGNQMENDVINHRRRWLFDVTDSSSRTTPVRITGLKTRKLLPPPPIVLQAQTAASINAEHRTSLYHSKLRFHLPQSKSTLPPQARAVTRRLPRNASTPSAA